MSLPRETDYGTPARESEKDITLSIDGIEVTVPAGTSVMRAAQECGNSIPKLCATDSLEPFGSCRLCLVEIEGRRGYPASCTTIAEAGMQVRTQTPKLADIRRGVMELYISDHPLDCLTCSANGNCELQDMTGVVGLREVRYGMKGKNHFDLLSALTKEKDESNPYFSYDPSKCIVCNRCVRACEETQGTFALTISGRGFDSRVSPGESQPFMESECVSCGACVQACPTATLMEKGVIEHGQAEKKVTTTCAYCGVGCSFDAEVKGTTVVRMVPSRDGGANHGHSCVKGRFAFGYATHADRITTPMIRRSIEDAWQPVSWDEAISYAASEFKRIQATHGRESVGGITSSRCTNEETYLVQKLVRAAFGNNNVDTCARVCHSPTGYGLKQTLGESAGTQTFDSVMKADVIMVMGANPTDGHPVFGSQMKRRLREGAKLIVVDPRSIDLVRSPHIRAEQHLKLKPGSNVALITSMAHVVVTEDLVQEDFVRERCEWHSFEQWRDFVARPENSPEAMEIHTGVPAADVRAAARLFATGGNAAIYYGLGVTEHSQGSTTVIGIANLAMATGNIGREGVGVNPLRGQNNVQGSCDMGSFPHELPGYRHVSDAATRALFRDAWGVEPQPEPGLRIPNMFEAAMDGTFLGLYCEGEDIVQSDPNTQHVEAALRAMECVVVQDLFLNETAKFAHVFLPGSSFLEKNGTFTNAERRISRVRKVMPPLAGKEDWEVTCMLSNALGYPMDYGHPSEIMDEIARLTPTFHGVSYARLDELGSIQWPCNEQAPEGTPIMHIDQFVRGKGRFMLTEYVQTEERTSKRFPLILTTGRILSQYNVGAQTRRTPNSMWHDEDRLEIHPADAETRGINEGDWVGITSRAGETVLRARVSERMQPGVVYTTFHFPESGANVITTDNSDWATNCPEYKVTAVEVTRVTQPSEWQQRYRDFSQQQIGLLPKKREKV
ncbi:MAG: formate dehydrogenase subunit alpha [Methyloversatilis discipulorum]|uniref:formate dehydrogenase subunit alpha n=1 Tax=Methyloversatilis discipulorum TaxID=1119528 RepID=UPI0026EF7E75|nr:formate dehydrogenase subunit alpha [Methyloversatilis discipulorum]MBT9517698.1 formate dehydrogenase subunit alpha [Methyloversatilis discipulorum]